MSAKPIKGPAAVVTIDGTHYLLPLVHASKVVQLLAEAVCLERDFLHDTRKWRLKTLHGYEQISMEAVDTTKIGPPERAAESPRLVASLGSAPKALGYRK